jgi:hypothetical protein
MATSTGFQWVQHKQGGYWRRLPGTAKDIKPPSLPPNNAENEGEFALDAVLNGAMQAAARPAIYPPIDEGQPRAWYVPLNLLDRNLTRKPGEGPIGLEKPRNYRPVKEPNQLAWGLTGAIVFSLIIGVVFVVMGTAASNRKAIPTFTTSKAPALAKVPVITPAVTPLIIAPAQWSNENNTGVIAATATTDWKAPFTPAPVPVELTRPPITAQVNTPAATPAPIAPVAVTNSVVPVQQPVIAQQPTADSPDINNGYSIANNAGVQQAGGYQEPRIDSPDISSGGSIATPEPAVKVQDSPQPGKPTYDSPDIISWPGSIGEQQQAPTYDSPDITSSPGSIGGSNP